MLSEVTYDLSNWWNDQNFPGKEWFRISDLNSLVFSGYQFLKEKHVAFISLETADVVLKNQQEHFLALEAKARELEMEWLAAEDKIKMIEKIEHFKDYMQHFTGVGDYARIVKLVADWEAAISELTKENYEAKLKLAEMAESLVENENFKDTTLAFKELAEKWKATGHIDRHRNDRLYNRIETARKKFMERKRVFHEEEEKDMIVNLDLKIEIIEKAEVLANSTEWKVATEAFHRLMDQWKAIGKTPNKKNEELWQRFQAARTVFFDRKKAHYNDVQQEQESNYSLKMVLIERAEAIKDSTEWGNTSQAFAAIMEEWKKVGKVQSDKADELWNRLNAAADIFFEAKKRHNEQQRAMFEANYLLKKELLDRAEVLKNATHFNDATIEFGKLMDEWRKIGPVTREHSNTMWDAFNEARRFFFARKDADRDRRKQHAEFRQQARVEEAKSKIVQINEDIKEEEQKLIDFTAALENISPGKKAAELKSHLENLLAETKKKINTLKEKQALANGEPAPKHDKHKDTQKQES